MNRWHGLLRADGPAFLKRLGGLKARAPQACRGSHEPVRRYPQTLGALFQAFRRVSPTEPAIPPAPGRFRTPHRRFTQIPQTRSCATIELHRASDFLFGNTLFFAVLLSVTWSISGHADTTSAFGRVSSVGSSAVSSAVSSAESGPPLPSLILSFEEAMDRAKDAPGLSEAW